MFRLKNIIFILFVLTLSTSKAQQTTTTIADNVVVQALNKFSSDKELENASYGFYAQYTDDASIVAGVNEKVALVPASILKVLTTAAVLEVFGSNYKFKTKIQYDGYIDSTGVLHGNIYIKGGGDPALGSYVFVKHYGDFLNQWVVAIKELGIHKITGAIIGDATIFDESITPQTWIWGDIGNYYGAGPSGLTVYDNMCSLTFKTGNQVGDSTKIMKIEPNVPYLVMDNLVKSAKIYSDKSYAYGGPYEYYRKIVGSIPLNKEEYKVKISLPDPPLLLATQLSDSLSAFGIGVEKSPTTMRLLRLKNVVPSGERKDFYTTDSPSLATLVYWTNLKSVNLFAEHFLCQLGLNKYGEGSTYSGAEALQSFWASKDVNTSGMYLNDGSGLSRFDAITVKQFVEVLQYMTKSKNATTFYKSLPVAGKSGSLHSMCKGTDAEGKINAKSGYMTRVRSYAGYATTLSGRQIAFTVIVNNFNCTPSSMKLKIEKLMVALAQMP